MKEKMKIGIMFAAGTNGAFGHKGQLPWTVPEDLRRFKRYTEGHAVIMGSKTWESLPKKPLKNRINIVLTQNVELAIQSFPDTYFVPTFDKAIVIAESVGCKEAWIIGGSSIIEENQHRADWAIVTKVEHKKSHDVKAPKLHDSLWVLNHKVDPEEEHAREAQVNFWYEYYSRKQPSASR